MTMEFTVEFYETEAERCPVRGFLDELKATDPDDFAAVLAVWQNCGTDSITVSRWRKL